MQPLVSVIIPVYNGEAFIAEAVESALDQDYPHKEVIVVNDGSNDGTMQVLRRFGDRIRILDQVNGGPPRARNAGLAVAAGEYIAFLDADDVWLQGKLTAQVTHMEAQPGVAVSYFQWHVWASEAGGYHRPEFSREPLRQVRVDDERSGWIYNRLLYDCELLTTTVMLRASVARKVGEFDVNLWCGEDYDYWLRMSQAGKISRLEPAGALYRVVPGSASRHARPINDELQVIQSNLTRFGLTDPSGAVVDKARLAMRLDALVFQHGYSHLHQGDPSIALEAFAANLRRRPFQPKLWLHACDAWLKRVRQPKTAVKA